MDAVTFSKIYHGIGKDLASRDRLPRDVQPLRDATRQKKAAQSSHENTGGKELVEGKGYIVLPYKTPQLKVGDEVVAVGSPFGLAGTHTFERHPKRCLSDD